MDRNDCATAVEKCTFDGLHAIRATAGGYTAILLPEHGFHLIRLRDNKSGFEILRCPDTAEELLNSPFLFGIPVLFPPNRIDGGKFFADGRCYQLPVNEISRGNHIHGILYREKWQTTYAKASSTHAVIRGVYVNNPEKEFYEYFPHEFEMMLEYVLSSDGLYQRIVVKNMSGVPMPFGLGYHTSFRFPMTDTDNWKLHVTLGDEWELDDRKLPTGRRLKTGEEFALSNNNFFCNERPISLHTTIRQENSFTGAVFESEDGEKRVVYEVWSGFKHWMIFNGGGNSGYICIEPQTWMINAPNIDLLSDITGFCLLPPDGVRNDITRIYCAS